jgi:Fe-S-cluster-containing hydrogenase component 2
MAKTIELDQKACTGCRQCELVCSVHHTGTANPSRARIHVIKWEAEGFYLPVFCQQCLEPACAAVCPRDAISRDGQTGLVTIAYERCIGCKLCVMACPYGAMAVDSIEGKITKCDLCGGDPYCVSFCEAGALRYVEEHTANIARMRASASRFLESLAPRERASEPVGTKHP